MAERTICPACGAPLEFEQLGDVVRCDFCGADVRYEDRDGAVQPHVMLHPAQEEMREVTQEALSEVVEEPVETTDSLYNPPLGTADPFVLPGSERGGAAVYGLPDSPPEVEPVLHGTVLDQNGAPVQAPAGSGGRNRWIVIGAASLLGLCVVCACIAGAISIFLNSGQ
jgi:hypothetical protein